MTTRIVLFFLLTFSIVNAEIRYASKTGSSLPPYTSWATAADSIQKAIDVCSYGDTVYVGTGVYKETVDMIQGLTLIGNGIDSTVIDGKNENSDGDIVLMSNHTKLQNFSIISDNDPNFYSDWCIGVVDTLDWECEVVINNNKCTSGKYGILSSNLYGQIQNNIIYNVKKGMDLATGLTHYYQLIQNNSISSRYHCITPLYGARPEIRNNILITSEGSIYYSWGGDIIKMYNNIMLLNGDDPLYWAMSLGANHVVVQNNILIGEWERGIVCGDNFLVRNNVVMNCENGIVWTDGSNPTVRYNNCWNNGNNYVNKPDSVTTNISVNPMFVNADTGNYQLQMFSPLIDAGDPGIFDLDGSRSDIGLFGGPFGRSYQYIDYPPLPPVEITGLVEENQVTLNWPMNSEADFSHYQVLREYNNSGIIETFLADTSFFTEYITGSVSEIKYLISSIDNQGMISSKTEKVIILSGVKNNLKTSPGYQLINNYPNPFNPSTKIIYFLEEESEVRLTVYDVKGEIIEELKNEREEAGWHEVNYNPGKKGETITSGIYLYVLEVRKNNRIIFSDMGKMIFLK